MQMQVQLVKAVTTMLLVPLELRVMVIPGLIRPTLILRPQVPAMLLIALELDVPTSSLTKVLDMMTLWAR